MSTIDHPIPVSVADRLRNIPPGESRWFDKSDIPPSSLRSTITRIKATAELNYTTRPEGNGLRVWRLG